MAKLSKKKVEELSKKLVYKPRFVWDEATASQRKEIMALGERFKSFISTAKTERMAVNEFRQMAEDNGFKELDARQKADRQEVLHDLSEQDHRPGGPGQKPGDPGHPHRGRPYRCPRLDFKTHPLFENEELAFLKDPLLRRDQKIPVGVPALGPARGDLQKGRQHS
jgi:hypothetical protein